MTTNSLNNSSAALTINGAFTFPTTDGAANQVLKTDGAGAVTWGTTAGTGEVVQYVQNSTSALINISTIIPYDDTIPQITEGTEVLTVTITPTNITHTLVIKLSFNGAGGSDPTMALFQDATANALAAVCLPVGILNAEVNSSLSYKMTAGTIAATTFRMRVGVIANAILANGKSVGATRVYGGVSSTTIEVWEIAV